MNFEEWYKGNCELSNEVLKSMLKAAFIEGRESMREEFRKAKLL